MLWDCGGQLIEIDRYGERLTGCIECNRWSSDKRAFVIELSVEDFEAIRGMRSMVGKRVQFDDATWRLAKFRAVVHATACLRYARDVGGAAAEMGREAARTLARCAGDRA